MLETRASNNTGSGSGSRLPTWVLASATVCAGLSTVLSLWTVWLQLKNYRKVRLQRFVVRILVMVPIYALSSLISLYSLEAAFFLDTVRDVYEAFVIYCFFTLLVEYLGGERSLLGLLAGRPAVKHPWPVSTCYPPLDASDPYTFLGLKRGVLQYVQIKPVLAAATVILKALGTYKDGSLEKDAGYTYISIIYNISVFLSLYCLAMFWVATHDDIKPFRPTPKFLCVKGIIFFSFWQGFAISVLVKIGWLKSSSYPTEQLSLAVQDTLMCFEMPFFAVLHLYAFSYTDFVDKNHLYSGRLPFMYALRDSLGLGDVFADSVETVKGTGFSYRTFEPAKGAVHVGRAQERRIKAGLRYAERGSLKYWLPMPGPEDEAHGRKGLSSAASRPIHQVRRFVENRFDQHEGYAPMREDQARSVLHDDVLQEDGEPYDRYDFRRWKAERGGAHHDDDDDRVDFGSPDSDEDAMYADSRRMEFGDYTYPVIDASKEEARRQMALEEERRLALPNQRQRKNKGKGKAQSLFARYDESPRDTAETSHGDSHEDNNDTAESSDKIEEAALRSSDAVDLIVEDKQAAEEEMIKSRRRGEPSNHRKRVYRQVYDDDDRAVPETVEGMTVTEVERAGHSDIIVEHVEQEAQESETPPELRDDDDHDPWRR